MGMLSMNVSHEVDGIETLPLLLLEVELQSLMKY